MKLIKKTAELFYPNNNDLNLSKTTHLCIAAHHDDIELMAYHGIEQCFQQKDLWFTGVVVTDGSGSPRDGLYKNYSDDEMKAVRKLEQKKAAVVGEYNAQFLLDFSSSEVKNNKNNDVIMQLEQIILECNPDIIYTHNLADKHDTHCAVVLRVIQAIRNIPHNKRPKHVYGCEVWRDLDWLVDSEKTVFDIGQRNNLAMSLISLFDSQIAGGKRYDLAIDGRRIANATYFESHGVDHGNRLSYALDITPLIENDKINPIEFISNSIENFNQDVKNRLKKFN